MRRGRDPVSPASRGSGCARWRYGLAIGLTLGAFAVVFAVAIELSRRHALGDRYRPRVRVNLEGTAVVGASCRPAPAAGRDRLRVGISPVISPESSLPLYQGIVRYLSRALDRRPVILQRRTYAEVNHLLHYRRCDLAFVCTYAFVQGEREFGLEMLAAPVIGGKSTYRSYIIVPRSSRARSLLDLEGRRFASADHISNTGWLYPATFLKARGKDPEAFFSRHLITGSHDRSVMAVVSGFVDGAAVDHLVFEHVAGEDPSIREKTRIIQRSPPFGMPPVVVPPGLEEALKARLRVLLLHMHEDAAGRRALAPLGIDRFEVPDRACYDSVRQAAAFLEGR